MSGPEATRAALDILADSGGLFPASASERLRLHTWFEQ